MTVDNGIVWKVLAAITGLISLGLVAAAYNNGNYYNEQEVKLKKTGDDGTVTIVPFTLPVHEKQCEAHRRRDDTITCPPGLLVVASVYTIGTFWAASLILLVIEFVSKPNTPVEPSSQNSAVVKWGSVLIGGVFLLCAVLITVFLILVAVRNYPDCTFVEDKITQTGDDSCVKITDWMYQWKLLISGVFFAFLSGSLYLVAAFTGNKLDEVQWEYYINMEETGQVTTSNVKPDSFVSETLNQNQQNQLCNYDHPQQRNDPVSKSLPNDELLINERQSKFQTIIKNVDSNNHLSQANLQN